MDLDETYTYLASLKAQLPAAPEKSIISQTFYKDEKLSAILFSFAQGEELSEHTASSPAIIHILEGEGCLTLGGDAKEARPGTWVYMPAGLPHSLYASTPLVMLLTLIR